MTYALHKVITDGYLTADLTTYSIRHTSVVFGVREIHSKRILTLLLFIASCSTALPLPSEYHLGLDVVNYKTSVRTAFVNELMNFISTTDTIRVTVVGTAGVYERYFCALLNSTCVRLVRRVSSLRKVGETGAVALYSLHVTYARCRSGEFISLLLYDVAFITFILRTCLWSQSM